MTEMNRTRIQTDMQTLTIATSAATKTIADAATLAAKALASAASDASQLITHNAEEVARVLNQQRGSDHDAIVRISEKIDSLRVDVKDLKDGTASRIATLENEKLNIKDSYPVLYKKAVEDFIVEANTRMRKLEEGYTQVKTFGIAAMILLGVVEFVLNKFLK